MVRDRLCVPEQPCLGVAGIDVQRGDTKRRRIEELSVGTHRRDGDGRKLIMRLGLDQLEPPLTFVDPGGVPGAGAQDHDGHETPSIDARHHIPPCTNRALRLPRNRPVNINPTDVPSPRSFKHGTAGNTRKNAAT